MIGYDYPAFLTAVRLQTIARGRVRSAPTLDYCFVCDVVLEETVDSGFRRSQERELCRKVGGPVDAHHLCAKRLLRSEWRAIRERLESRGVVRELDAVLMDARNGVLARRRHHDMLENRALVIPKGLWPEDALEFAREVGLEWWIDKMEARRS